MDTTIWVDTETGTWGANPSSLRMVNVTALDLENMDGASDSEIIEFALNNGVHL